MKYRPKHIIEYVALRLVAGLVRILPLRAALGLGWLLAAAMHFIGKINVERTRNRLRGIFGDTYTEKEIRRMAWISWRNLCFNGVEALRFSMLSPEKLRKQPLAHLEARLKNMMEECDAGFIFATPHMGNWELAGITGDLFGLPLFTVVRRQKNPLMNDYINQMRETFNLELLYQESRMWKHVVDRIKEGKVLAILPDVRAKGKGVKVDYLNGTTTVTPSIALFAQLAECPVYPAFIRRIGWTKHDAIILDPIKPDPSLDKKEDQERIMQAVMSAFTEQIFKYPEQYFWYNKRWVLDKKS